MSDGYLDRVNAILDDLNISHDMFAHRNLPFFYEPENLLVAETNADGIEFKLVPDAVVAWKKMAEAAKSEGVDVFLVHGFRDLESQADIIRWRLRTGHTLETALLGSAPPGYSEHHTGRAIDIATPGCPLFEDVFEQTPAFAWLDKNANDFGFFLSFPRGNVWGYVYEPWHWFYRPGFDYPSVE